MAFYTFLIPLTEYFGAWLIRTSSLIQLLLQPESDNTAQLSQVDAFQVLYAFEIVLYVYVLIYCNYVQIEIEKLLATLVEAEMDKRIVGFTFLNLCTS